MNLFILLIIVSSFLLPQDNCILNDTISHRSLYNIGDYISEEDQNTLYPVWSEEDDAVEVPNANPEMMFYTNKKLLMI